jgi:preprotein translocase subunit YajC
MMSLAYAMGVPGAGGGQGGDIQFIIMMTIVFLIFYFLLIRPQQKKQKELKQMIENVKHGDTVITTGGIYGKVMAVTDNIVSIEIADKVRVKVLKSHIGALAEKSDKEA